MKLPVPRRSVEAGRAWWEQSLYRLGWERIRELDLDTHALALCAQQVLCTAPLIVAMSAVLQRTNGRGISWLITKFVGLSGPSQQDVDSLFHRTAPSISTPALVFAMITAVVFSTSVGAVQQRAFELIWSLPRHSGVRSYLRQLVWAFVLAAYCMGIIVVGRLGRLFGHAFDVNIIAATVFQAALTFAFYWWSQHWLLHGRIAWRSLLPGAIAVGVASSLAVRLARVIIPPQIRWQVDAYGLIGGVFVLSVFLMVLSAVIFGGVLLGALIIERRVPERAGETRPPLTDSGLESVTDERLPAQQAMQP